MRSVSDADLERALRTLAACIAAHGDAAMPLFDRLEAEKNRRADRRRRIGAYLETPPLAAGSLI